jgi:hypothetical protein
LLNSDSITLWVRFDSGPSYSGTKVIFCEIKWGTRMVYVVAGFAKVNLKKQTVKE